MCVCVHSQLTCHDRAIEEKERPIVFISAYEHHANEVMWRESIADVSVCVSVSVQCECVCGREAVQCAVCSVQCVLCSYPRMSITLMKSCGGRALLM